MNRITEESLYYVYHYSFQQTECCKIHRWPQRRIYVYIICLIFILSKRVLLWTLVTKLSMLFCYYYPR
jgi:hypothetical protein